MNTSFLCHVASWLKTTFGNDLSQVVVVFPNKRASLFLNEALTNENEGKPLWSPLYFDMRHLFSDLRNGQLKVADDIELICRLYRIFLAKTHFQIDEKEETLDHFFGWGEVLLSDFDDLDKNMADASSVFRNVKELHDFDSSEFLDEKQKETLQKYFSDFNANGDMLRENFLSVWNNLHEVYQTFNEELLSQGVTYEGALFRQIAEEAKQHLNDNDTAWYETNFPMKKYIFVGFNMMQKAEQTLIDCLQKMGKAEVIWNYDNYYLKAQEQEAGTFLRTTTLQSLDTSSLDITGEVYDNMRRTAKNITYLKSSTDDAQVRYVRQWLTANDGERLKAGNKTAIVLCDESLLPSVLHALPEGDYPLNVTMGYPIKQTELASFVFALLSLCYHGIKKRKDGKATLRMRQLRDLTSIRYFYMIANEDIDTYLNDCNAFFKDIADRDSIENLDPKTVNEILQAALSKLSLKTSDSPFLQESVFRIWTTLNRLNDLMSSGVIDLTPVVHERLIVQLLSTLSVPFHGEPAEGIQIMGVLETRCLDFDHVLMLSCNEGYMPKSVNDTSFLPYIVRKANNLTTIDNKVAVFAYYFYSILQRASDITIAYCDNNDSQGQAKERSRFLLQLLVEKSDNITLSQKELTATSSRRRDEQPVMEIPKTQEDINIIKEKDFSPSALITYMRCGLKYYYHYVLGLKEPQDLNADEALEASTFGSIFHLTAQYFYEDARKGDTEKLLTDSFFDEWIDADGHWQKGRKGLAENFADMAMIKILSELRATTPEPNEWEGLDKILKQSVVEFMRRLLIIDKSRTPFRVAAMEAKVEGEVDGWKIGGFFDRLDKKDNDLWIIDYKTGKWVMKDNSVAIGNNIGNVSDIKDLRNGKLRELIRKNGKTKADYYFQTLLYCFLKRKQEKNNYVHIVPRLLYPLSMTDLNVEDNDLFKLFGGAVDDPGTNDWYDAFGEFLKNLLSEIADTRQPFRTDYAAECDDNYCKFQDLCHRKKKETSF